MYVPIRLDVGPSPFSPCSDREQTQGCPDAQPGKSTGKVRVL